MSHQDQAAPQFPRDAYLELLQTGQHLFNDQESRRKLLESLGMTPEDAGQRQPRPADAAAATFTGEEALGDPLENASPARFASLLVNQLSEPGQLDVALKLARRMASELGKAYDAVELLKALETLYVLHRKQIVESGDSRDLGTYREWVGFEVAHHYSLSDRFFGREKQLKELDEWLTPDGASISVRCLCALGGSGKSALAWHWLNRAMPSMRERGYRGAFWCSFYEKDFDFENFLRRTLIFGGRLSEAEVEGLSRTEVEARLLDVLRTEPFVIVVDGLERLMNGYAIVFARAVDPDSIPGGKSEQEVTAYDRRLTDPRSGAFLRRLASGLASRILITTRLGPAELEDGSTGREIPHALFTQLGGLSPNDVAALWKSIIPRGDLPDEVRWIFTLSGNHPLVVSILARSVASSGGDWMAWRSAERHRDVMPGKGASEAEIRSHIIGACVRDLEELSYDVLGVLTTSGKPMSLALLSNVLLQGSAANGDDRWSSEQQVVTEVQRLVSLGFVGVAEAQGQKEYDVHPVVRGAAWNLITDPRREGFLRHALSEFFATPDKPEAEIDLNRPTALFQLLVRSGEIDRAWEMYINKLWLPLALRNDKRTLLGLLELLLPNGDALQLLPLRSRREQGNSTEVLGSLLMSAGDGDRSDKLLRWCGAIRLQTGDFLGFLYARQDRCWQTLYEGLLFQTERDLRVMREDAVHFGAAEIQPTLDCWIGIILALRGCEQEARRHFTMAEGKTDYRWWAQALAEGYVYLNSPDEALVWLDQAQDALLHPLERGIQVAWEQLTRGIAMFQKGKLDEAFDNLSNALNEALRANYSIIQCFAIPYMADILRQRDQIDEAESQVDTYFRIDPDSQYQLSASDAWRVRALCKLARGERDLAKEYSSKAYRLAACDGPPFVYQEGLRRALDTLEKCGAYVPRAEARLHPEWKRLLKTFQSDPQSESVNGAEETGDSDTNDSMSKEKAWELLRETALMREASEEDRRWWSEITKDAPSAIELPLARAMASLGISLEKFRGAFEASAHKSVLVVFHQLHAESIVAPAAPLPFGELDEPSARAWLENTQEHSAALAHFLSTDFAGRVAYAFQVHDLDKTGIRAFLNDNKRRIDYAKAPAVKAWWDRLEQTAQPMDMLILSEAVHLTGLPLEEFVNAIATGTARGIEYAFAAILVKRAVQDLELKAISRTEGWSDVQIFLRLEDVKQRLSWRAATAPAREFWASIEKSNSQQIERVLQIAEELAIRGATIDDYYKAYLFSNTDNVQANLSYVDYVRLKDTAWDGAPTWSRSSGRPLLPEGAALGFSETGDWTEEQVKNRLGVLKKTKLGYDSATESVRRWWTSLESLHPPKVILRLAEELEVRAATLADLHLARVDGATENIPAAFAYLDFTRVKLNAVQRAKDLNRAGNTHFESKRYSEAVASYEAAIRESPDNEIFYTNLAGAWEQIDDMDRMEALEKAIQVLERGSKYCSQSESIRKKLKTTKLQKRLFEQGGYTKAPSMAMLSVVTPIGLEVASNLIPLVENETSALFAQMSAMRERIRKSTGFLVPGIRIRGNETGMPQGSYLIMINEIPLVMGTVDLDKLLATLPESTLKERGILYERAVNPVDGSDAFWVNAADADGIGGAAWDAPEYIERHLEAVIVANIGDFVTHETVTGRLRDEWGAQSREIAGDAALLGRFVRILRALLDERVSTIEFGPLCRAFLEKSREGANLDETLQALRMLPEIRPSLPGNQEHRLLGLSDAIEDQIVAGLHAHGDERLLALLPEPTQEILSAVRTAVGSVPGSAALVMRNTLARRYMRKLVELEFTTLWVLAKAELNDGDTRKIERTIDLE